MIIGGGEQGELIHAPDLAEVSRAIVQRPHYLADQPLAVDPQLWVRAQDQLRDVLQARGWPMLTDDKCRRMNFLLHGVPVVMLDG